MSVIHLKTLRRYKYLLPEKSLDNSKLTQRGAAEEKNLRVNLQSNGTSKAMKREKQKRGDYFQKVWRLR